MTRPEESTTVMLLSIMSFPSMTEGVQRTVSYTPSPLGEKNVLSILIEMDTGAVSIVIPSMRVEYELSARSVEEIW